MQSFTEETGNTVSSEEEPEVSYRVLGNGSVISEDGELHSVLKSGIELELSDTVKSIRKNAFRNVQDLRVIHLPGNGKCVDLEEGSLAGSSIREIQCYSDEQYEQVLSQLERSGADSSVKVSKVEIKLNPEGYEYYQRPFGEYEENRDRCVQGLCFFERSTDQGNRYD